MYTNLFSVCTDTPASENEGALTHKFLKISVCADTLIFLPPIIHQACNWWKLIFSGHSYPEAVHTDKCEGI